MKVQSPLTLAASSALIVSASATVTRHEAANFGYNDYYAQIGQIVATNNLPYPMYGPYDPNIQYGNQPYSNSIDLLENGYTHGTGSYSGQDGIAEFSVTGLVNAQHYYLEVSPWALAAGGGFMASFDIYKAYGNGLVQPDDFNAGTFFSSVSLSQGGDPAGWYNPNPYGGFYGDSYVDITSLVEEAKNAGESFILFRYDATEGHEYFRAPAILASDSILENQWGAVPEPTSMLLTMVAGCMMLIRRKR